MERDKGLCNCLVVKGNFDELSNHASTCPYRLKYDELSMSVEFSEQEVLGLVFVFEQLKSLKVLDEVKGFASARSKLQETLKNIATVRTGQMPLTLDMLNKN